VEVLHHSLQHGWRNCCYVVPDVVSNPPLSLVPFVQLALEISSEEELLRLETLVAMNIEVPTKYPLSQDGIVVFENRPPPPKKNHRCSTDQRSMATEMR
jgi:hypothetical protein